MKTLLKAEHTQHNGSTLFLPNEPFVEVRFLPFTLKYFICFGPTVINCSLFTQAISNTLAASTLAIFIKVILFKLLVSHKAIEF